MSNTRAKPIWHQLEQSEERLPVWPPIEAVQSRQDSFPNWGIVASYKPVVTVRRTVDLMQTSGWAAKRSACPAVKMLVVQDDCLEAVSIMGERMQGSGRTALVKNRVANIRRKAFNMLGGVAIFASIAAAFRERLNAD
jgi:hypothetical protein